MSKDRCPYNSFFGEKVMIKEKLSLIWGKFVNRETISYLIFGVLTTLVDWISYAVFRHNGMNYRMATICCQAAAILFAYVTNKIWVFRSYNFHPVYLLKEMASFFSCRILTSVFTYVAMIVMGDGTPNGKSSGRSLAWEMNWCWAMSDGSVMPKITNFCWM